MIDERRQNMDGRRKYLEEHGARRHYFECPEGGYALLFKQAWVGTVLPPDVVWRRGVGFESDFGKRYDELKGAMLVYLLDREDGKVHETKMIPSYVPNDLLYAGDSMLNGYFYGEHFCACNRKLAARKAGAVVENEDCEGERFDIQKIVTLAMPDLILYSETMSIEELERELAPSP